MEGAVCVDDLVLQGGIALMGSPSGIIHKTSTVLHYMPHTNASIELPNSQSSKIEMTRILKHP